jgi:FkbM family methyltransferase
MNAGLKQLMIATGLYRTARRVQRLLSATLREEYAGLVALYRTLIPTGALCFDVGANIGEKSEALLAAGCQVVAFEPNPLVLPELRARLKRAENWSLVEAAVGRAAGSSRLYARYWHGKSSLSADWAENETPGEVIGTFDVPMITLDAAVARFGTPAFCKIDVEGWEGEVLAGLSRPIHLIAFEFHALGGKIEPALDCLRTRQRLGPAVVNLTAGERPHLRLAEWMPIDRFLSQASQYLTWEFLGIGYGDLYVRSA